jgi:tetratricopeptide (TPR) repeat protein
LLLHNYDWQGAEEAFRSALQVEATNINALHWYSHLLSWQGKHADAITAAELAVQADPLSPLMKTNLNYILIDARRWDEAFEIANELLETDVYSSLQANSWIGLLRARMAEDAAAMLLAWAEATGRDREAATEVGELIIAAQALGEPAELTDELIDRLGIGAEGPELFAALGDAENTLAALEDAYRTGAAYRSLLSMKINPSYDFVRQDPRFIKLLREIGLAD